MKSKFKIIVSLAFFYQSLFAQSELKLLYDKGIAAYNAGNHQSFLEHMVKANKMRPNHPTLTYKLAAAHALNNQQAAAFEVMRHIILMNATVSFEQDPDFASITSSVELQGLNELSKKLQQPINNSQMLKKVDLGGLHPEGIAYNTANERWLVGGVHERKIVQINQAGNVTDFISYKSYPDIYGVMAIAVDSKQRMIWLCSAALPEMMEYMDDLQGHSSVMAFDFDGNLLHSEKLVGNHVFGDMVLKSDGSVLISDTGENKIFTTSIGNKIKQLKDLSPTVLNLQGITFDQEEDFLYFSDYLTGLYRMKMDDLAVKKIDLGKGVSDKGFDGLKYHQGSLLGIQNGVTPKKTWHLTLSQDGTEIKTSKVIDQALEFLNEPTQGLIHDQSFIYVANSPWGAYENGQLKTEQLTETIFLRYPLNN